MVWLRVFALPLSIAAVCGLENTWGKGKIELCMCVCQPVVSDPKRTRKKV